MDRVVTRRRAGRTGQRLVSAVAIAAGYVVLLRWLRDSHPGPAKRLEW